VIWQGLNPVKLVCM